MKDYNSRYPLAGGKRQKITRRGPGAVNPEDRKWFWRATGVLVLLAMIMGVVVTLWLGYRINSSLAELTAQQERLDQETARNRLLREQQEQLLSEERLQEAVRDSGLKPPAATQIKKM